MLMFSYNSNKYSYLIITRNNKVLKDIYSPLEIDDQWDQRAPSHEDRVEGGNPDGISSVPPQMQAEDPSGGGGVAVAEQQPAASPGPEEVTAAINQEVSQGIEPANQTAGMQADEAHGDSTTEAGQGSITNIGQMTVPAETVDPTNDTNPTAMPADMPPVTMESTSTDVPGTETPEVANDDEAATMLDSGQQDKSAENREHDIPASPYDTVMPENDTNSSNEPGDATIETSAIPTTTVEPDEAHKVEEEPDEDAVKQIVEEPLSDDEREAVASDTDQMPISPEPDVNKTESADNDEVTAEVNRGMEKVLKAIEAELEALENRKSRLQEALTKHEQDRADADAQATATQAQIDQVEAAISELESKK